jgi:hypothetical protein
MHVENYAISAGWTLAGAQRWIGPSSIAIALTTACAVDNRIPDIDAAGSELPAQVAERVDNVMLRRPTAFYGGDSVQP